jgi:hypothetical protein
MNNNDREICKSQLYLCDCDDRSEHIGGGYHDMRCSYAEWFFDCDWNDLYADMGIEDS